MNSRTSRPRSPTSAITMTSAVGAARHHARAACTCRRRSRRRCRCAGRGRRGRAASIARTPSGKRLLDRLALERRRAARRRWALRAVDVERRQPSIGRPRPSSTRPSRPSPTATGAAGRWRRAVAGRDARHVAERHQQRARRRGSRPPRPAAARPRRVASIRQRSPTSASGPVDSTTRPITSATRPLDAVRVGQPEPLASTARGPARQSCASSPSRAARMRSSWAPASHRRRRPACARSRRRAARGGRRSARGPELPTAPGARPAPSSRCQVLGVPDDHQPVAHVRLAKRAAQHVGDALGLGVERGLEDLLRRLDGELDQRRLVLLEQPGAVSETRGRPIRRIAAGRRSRAGPAPCPPRTRPGSRRARRRRSARPARAPPRPARRPGAARRPEARSGPWPAAP